MDLFVDLKDKVLLQKCKIHPSFPCDMIYLNQHAKNRRICSKCLQQNKFQLEDILYIRELLEAEQNIILETYPPLKNKELLPQLIIKDSETLFVAIDGFFDEVIKEFQSAIERKRKDVKNSLISRNNMQQKIQDAYQEIADLKSLKEALIEGLKEDTNLGENLLDQVIKQAHQNSEDNTHKIEKLVLEISKNTGELQLEEPLKQISQIISKIEKISLFDSSKSVNILPLTQLIKSTLSTSFQASVTKNDFDHHIAYSNTTTGTLYCQAYLDFILEPSVNYVIQIDFQQLKYQDKFFGFGIILDSKKNSAWVSNENLCYLELNSKCGVNKLVKGPPIITNDNNMERRSLECRINIQKRVLKVGTFPDYEAAVEADNPSLIDPSGEYRFMLIGLNSTTKMTIVNIQKVSDFEDQM